MSHWKFIKTALATLSLTLCSLTSHAAITTIKDVNGRSVTLDLPAKRVLLGFYIEDYFAVGGNASFDKLAGMSRGWFVSSRPATWAQYVASKPQLQKVPDVGNVQDQTFSIEKVLASRPDVVVLADWQYKALGPDLARLEAAKIPVVVIDYNAQTLERHLASTRILGEITGEKARAAKIAGEYQKIVTDIQQRIAKAKLPKPRAYIELGDKGPSEYSYTYGKNMWGAMASLAGGENVAAPFVENWGPINPEQLLASKPEVILIAGYENVKSPTAMQIGFGIDQKESIQRLKGFTQRNGWSELPAVKNKRVFGVYHGATRSILDAALLQFLAKSFYPTVFKDYNPEATYLGFYKRYLPIQPKGTFEVSL
ncbi:ABC transporter substrate-binding protein [Leeia sp. TBRC 13508]|uniref:ABC transporter substrate-binding protein n=1 Tax=Leeia speluncae TaxID=2884804 RepID=A0ABS8D3D9_9NEIS|nr:ABC transporter substrate-binding protein [Leeia speluncae]MCB6182707.1 ABC transporter substrate-binding protein [Leeia speluncae]